ncbi:hypothetical protein KSS87_013287 [Heliosperma pusillum]|nr:hypothetical protein KSS87_013287 [Heliosperma pusillum]
MFLTLISRQKLHSSSSLLRHLTTTTTTSSSTLRSKYSFTPPPSLPSPNPDNPRNPNNPNPTHKKTKKPLYRPPSSLTPTPTTATNNNNKKSTLPFDFRFSYTESNPNSRPIGLREPRYSPFGPGRIDREWTGFCAPVKPPRVTSVDGDDEEDEDYGVLAGVGVEEDKKMVKKRKVMRDRVQGTELTEAERKILVDNCLRAKTKRQINLGRDGLTHNMLNDIHNHWKHAEAVRIKCMGVPTIDMKNVCTQLEDKTFGKIILRHGRLLVLYRGRNYKPKKRPVIPLMLWKPSRNGYYGNLVSMVRDAFLVEELVRIDCTGLDKSDHKKIGVKLRDLVPCTLVTFMKEQIVMWRGKEYQPKEDGVFLTEPKPSEISVDNLVWD